MNGEGEELIFEDKSMVEPMRECYGSKFVGPIPNAIFLKLSGDTIEHPSIVLPFLPHTYPGIVDELNGLQFKYWEENIKRDCFPHNIFGVEIEPETPKEPTPEEIRKQEEFSGKMTQLRHFMEKNNITVDDIKDEFDLCSNDEMWD